MIIMADEDAEATCDSRSHVKRFLVGLVQKPRYLSPSSVAWEPMSTLRHLRECLVSGALGSGVYAP